MSNRFAHLSDLMDELKPFERAALFIWIGLSVVLILGLAAVGIPYISTFSYHSPLAIFVLLLFAPLLLIMTERTPHEDEGMGLDYDKIALLLVLEMIGIILALFLPLPWYLNPATFIVTFLIPLYVALFVLKIPRNRLGFTEPKMQDVLGSLILTLAYAKVSMSDPRTSCIFGSVKPRRFLGIFRTKRATYSGMRKVTMNVAGFKYQGSGRNRARIMPIISRTNRRAILS